MKKILVLGGGADQKDLILDLKQRGYYTILIDYYQNPIAKNVADKHIQESTLDKEKVLKIAQLENVDNIITACTDQALLTVAYVAEKLNFPTQFSYQQALNITNKLYMKKIMWENGIPTSRYKCITDANEDISDLQFPLMVKPADCNGSFGVRKAENEEDFKTFFRQAVQLSRSKSAIVEEFKEGIEVGIDCYIIDGKSTILMMGQVNKKKIGDSVLLIFQTIIPALISDNVKCKIQNIANQIASSFNLNNTPLLIQTLVNGEDVNVIEFAARIGGASKHRTIRIKTGFDILHANIDSVFGFIPEVRTVHDSSYYSRNHVYTYPCVYDRVENCDVLIAENIIEEFIPYKTSGMLVEDSLASRDRIGSFLVKASSIVELNEKIRIAVDRLRVYDKDGNEVMRRDIFA